MHDLAARSLPPSSCRSGRPRGVGPAWLLAVVAAVLLPGCANFKAASAFAGQTTGMTGVVRTEFAQLQDLCVRQAELDIVVANRADEAPLDDCRRWRAAQGRLADVTLTVLDDYAKALAALADDRTFDASAELKTLNSTVQGLKDDAGRSLIDAREAGLLTRLSGVLVDAVSSSSRADAIGRLAAEAPNLRATGQMLKSFFVATDDAPPGRRLRPPYANLLDLTAGAAASSERQLAGTALRQAEPIRTAELLRELRARQALIRERRDSGPDAVPARIVAAIDAWQEALDAFATDALKPDPRTLYGRLAALHDKVSAARQAVGERPR